MSCYSCSLSTQLRFLKTLKKYRNCLQFTYISHIKNIWTALCVWTTSAQRCGAGSELEVEVEMGVIRVGCLGELVLGAGTSS